MRGLVSVLSGLPLLPVFIPQILINSHIFVHEFAVPKNILRNTSFDRRITYKKQIFCPFLNYSKFV